MTRPGSGLGIGMPLRYFGSSMVSRGVCRASMPDAPELLIFVRPDEVAGDLAVARHGDGLALGAHPVAAEIAGELRSRDGLGRVHRSLSIPPNIHNSRDL